jgi:hypothetical protein
MNARLEHTQSVCVCVPHEVIKSGRYTENSNYLIKQDILYGEEAFLIT